MSESEGQDESETEIAGSLADGENALVSGMTTDELEDELLGAVSEYFDSLGTTGQGSETDIVLSAVRGDSRDRADGLRGLLTGLFAEREYGVVDTPPASEFIDSRWFDFSPIQEYDIVEEYWVNPPFAHVTILYERERRRRKYHVTEPVLTEFEQHLRRTLVSVLRSELMYSDIDMHDDPLTVFATELRAVVNEYAATANPGTVHKLLYYLVRDFLHYGKIDPLMRDDRIEDISCDAENIPVYVFHDSYRDLETNIVFDGVSLNSMTIRLAQMADKQISVSNPLVDGTLPDGSRIQLTLGGDVANRGSNFTIRNFSDVPLTPVDLIKFGTFSVTQMAYFWLAIQNGRSLMFAGGTGSGKTTSMNSVSFFIPPDSKVVSIEDTLEITLPHENWVQLTTRESASASNKGGVSMYNLLEASLRQRPEYLLIGEIRTDPNVALTFFQAITTGHTAYTTFHSDSVEGVLSRLRNPPLQIPVQMLRELDIVSIQRQVFLEEERVRRTDTVAELGTGTNPTEVEPQTVFEHDPMTDSFKQVTDSTVLADIARDRGWSDDRLQAAMDARKRVLEYLIENDITEYPDVAATIQMFAHDAEFVMDEIANDTLNPSDFPVEI